MEKVKKNPIVKATLAAVSESDLCQADAVIILRYLAFDPHLGANCIALVDLQKRLTVYSLISRTKLNGQSGASIFLSRARRLVNDQIPAPPFGVAVRSLSDRRKTKFAHTVHALLVEARLRASRIGRTDNAAWTMIGD